MKVIYSWLKEYVGEGIPSVEKLEDLLTFHAFEIDGKEEREGETILDVKVLPDRSSDCLSHRGIAREIATLIDTPLAQDPLREEVLLAPKAKELVAEIHTASACTRFTAALVTGVTVQESPTWLKARIEALGQRSINNIVDATNYVMYALGQPLHAYDAGKLSHEDGMWRLQVRMARGGEEITTLSGEEYTLDPSIQLIVDAGNDRPIGIAGIKGGVEALVSSQTTAIILEAATFDPAITRKASQVLRLATDASKRFENELPAMLAPYALTIVVRLISEIAGGMCEGYIDVYPNPSPENSSATLTLQHTNALLGLSLTRHDIENILHRLGCTFTSEGDLWKVTPPRERTDLILPEDFIADIGRVYGYEHVIASLPKTVSLQEYNASHYYAEKIRNILVPLGFSEVITSSFRNKDEITLQNALASDKGSLRSTLRKNMSEVLDKNMPNLDLLGLAELQIFEIGTVFTKNETHNDVVEYIALAIGVRKKQQGYTPKDDERLREVIKEIETMLNIPLEGQIDHGVFECNLSAYIKKLPLPKAYDGYEKSSDAIFVPYSPYPFISRDIALWVPEAVTAASIETFIRKYAGELLVRLGLFDTFTKEGRTSYAFRLVFQSMERTLKDEDVMKIMQQIYEECQKMGYTVR